jgi:hypothetical protein
MTIKLLKQRRRHNFIFGVGSVLEFAPGSTDAYASIVRNSKQRQSLTLARIGSSLHQSMENFVDGQEQKNEGSIVGSGKTNRYATVK